MPEFEETTYKNRFDIIAKCTNPKSNRVIVGITFFRETNQLESEAAAISIQNAQEKLQYCPPNCTQPCALKNLANASPEMVVQMINSNPLQLNTP
jgi:hypothetical protein